jgi:hypothetical protein
MLLDESFDAEPDDYRLTRLYQVDGRLLRVTVHRNFYPRQSWAAAHLLTPVLTWTELLSAPPRDWHPATPPSRRATAETLAPVADRLLSRATTALSSHTTTIRPPSSSPDQPTTPAAEPEPDDPPTTAQARAPQ